MYAERTFVLRAGLAVAKTPGPSLQPAVLLDAAVSTQRHDVLAGAMPLYLSLPIRMLAENDRLDDTGKASKLLDALLPSNTTVTVTFGSGLGAGRGDGVSCWEASGVTAVVGLSLGLDAPHVVGDADRVGDRGGLLVRERLLVTDAVGVVDSLPLVLRDGVAVGATEEDTVQLPVADRVRVLVEVPESLMVLDGESDGVREAVGDGDGDGDGVGVGVGVGVCEGLCVEERVGDVVTDGAAEIEVDCEAEALSVMLPDGLVVGVTDMVSELVTLGDEEKDADEGGGETDEVADGGPVQSGAGTPVTPAEHGPVHAVLDSPGEPASQVPEHSAEDNMAVAPYRPAGHGTQGAMPMCAQYPGAHTAKTWTPTPPAMTFALVDHVRVAELAVTREGAGKSF